jgi:hypothetical protein
MPIYTYRIKGDDTTFEVIQEGAEGPYEVLSQVEYEALVGPVNPHEEWESDTEIERITSAPGLFIGLPTPKFYGHNR